VTAPAQWQSGARITSKGFDRRGVGAIPRRYWPPFFRERGHARLSTPRRYDQRRGKPRRQTATGDWKYPAAPEVTRRGPRRPKGYGEETTQETVTITRTHASRQSGAGISEFKKARLRGVKNGAGQARSIPPRPVRPWRRSRRRARLPGTDPNGASIRGRALDQCFPRGPLHPIRHHRAGPRGRTSACCNARSHWRFR
jgi:hypothetical protein